MITQLDRIEKMLTELIKASRNERKSKQKNAFESHNEYIGYDERDILKEQKRQ